MERGSIATFDGRASARRRARARRVAGVAMAGDAAREARKKQRELEEGRKVRAGDARAWGGDGRMSSARGWIRRWIRHERAVRGARGATD